MTKRLHCGVAALMETLAAETPSGIRTAIMYQKANGITPRRCGGWR